jgi:hypothetical protein
MTPDHPIMMGHECPYCGSVTEYVDSIVVYIKKSYGMIYLCRPCDAWVGVHRGTSQALGRLADKQLRMWKRKAHEAFDKIWQTGRLSRDNAYYWLSIQLFIPREITHMGMFDIEQCKMVVKVCNTILKTEDERRTTNK